MAKISRTHIMGPTDFHAQALIFRLPFQAPTFGTTNADALLSVSFLAVLNTHSHNIDLGNALCALRGLLSSVMITLAVQMSCKISFERFLIIAMLRLCC